MTARLVWLTDADLRALRLLISITHENLVEQAAAMLSLSMTPPPGALGQQKAKLARIALPGITDEMAFYEALSAKLAAANHVRA